MKIDVTRDNRPLRIASLDDLRGSDVLCANQRFQIPNTIFMPYLGELGAVGRRFVQWQQQVDYFAARGFKVIDNGDQYLHPERMLSNIKALADDRSLQGLYAWGHGYPGAIVKKASLVSGPQYDIHYSQIDDILNYRLALVIVNACFSDSCLVDVEGPNLVSASGRFRGHPNVLDPTGTNLYGSNYIKAQDVLPKGAQATRGGNFFDFMNALVPF